MGWTRRASAAAAALAVGGALAGCQPPQPWANELVSQDTAGGAANGDSVDADFSPDGTKVLFTSSADDLGPTDSPGAARPKATSTCAT